MCRLGANIKLSLLRESVWYIWGSFVGNLTKKTTFLAIYFYRPPTKVMLSQVSVCHSVHGGRWVCLVPDLGVGWLVCQEHSPGTYAPRRNNPRKVHLKCWHLVVAIEAGGMDPTGMLSCKCRWSCKKYEFNWGRVGNLLIGPNFDSINYRANCLVENPWQQEGMAFCTCSCCRSFLEMAKKKETTMRLNNWNKSLRDFYWEIPLEMAHVKKSWKNVIA